MNKIDVIDGIMTIPYNTNKNKITVVETDSSGKICKSKTFNILKSSKPTLLISITPETTNRFIYDASNRILNALTFNTNYTFDGSNVYNSDVSITCDSSKYSCEVLSPTKIKISVTGASCNKITSNDIIPLTLKYNGFDYNYNLNVEYSLGAYKITSLADTLYLSGREDISINDIIPIDVNGYFNEVSLDKRLLDIHIKHKDIGKYINLLTDTSISRSNNNWQLLYNIKGNNEISNVNNLIVEDGLIKDITIDNNYIDNTNCIYINGKKRVDASGNVYYNNSKIIDSSNCIIEYNDIKIDASNTILTAADDASKLDASGNVWHDGSIIYDASNKTIYVDSSNKIANMSYTDDKYTYKVYNLSDDRLYFDSSSNEIKYNGKTYCTSDGSIELRNNLFYNKNTDIIESVNFNIHVNISNKIISKKRDDKNSQPYDFDIVDGSVFIYLDASRLDKFKVIQDNSIYCGYVASGASGNHDTSLVYNYSNKIIYYGGKEIYDVSNKKILPLDSSYYDVSPIDNYFYPCYKNTSNKIFDKNGNVYFNDSSNNKLIISDSSLLLYTYNNNSYWYNFNNDIIYCNGTEIIKFDGEAVDSIDSNYVRRLGGYVYINNSNIKLANENGIVYIYNEYEYYRFDDNANKYIPLSLLNNDNILLYYKDNMLHIKDDEIDEFRSILNVSTNLYDTSNNIKYDMSTNKISYKINNSYTNIISLHDINNIDIRVGNIDNDGNVIIYISHVDVYNRSTKASYFKLYSDAKSEYTIYFLTTPLYGYYINRKEFVCHINEDNSGYNEPHVIIDSSWNIYTVQNDDTSSVCSKKIKDSSYIYYNTTSSAPDNSSNLIPIFDLNNPNDFICNDNYKFDISNKEIMYNSESYIKFDSSYIGINDVSILSNGETYKYDNITLSLFDKTIEYKLSNNSNILKSINNSSIVLTDGNSYTYEYYKDSSNIYVNIKDNSIAYLSYHNGDIYDDSSHIKITNTNKDRLLFYFDGSILKYNYNDVSIINKDNLYYDISTGNVTLLCNITDNNITHSSLNTIVFNKDQILDKYNNVIINDKYSYNIIDSTYRNKDNIIVNDPSNIESSHKVECMVSDGLWYYNSIGRKICDISCTSIYIDDNISYNVGNKSFNDLSNIITNGDAVYYYGRLIQDASFIYSPNGNKLYDISTREVYDVDGSTILCNVSTNKYTLNSGYYIKDGSLYDYTNQLVTEIVSDIKVDASSSYIYKLYNVELDVSNNKITVNNNEINYLIDSSFNIYNIFTGSVQSYTKYNETYNIYNNIYKLDDIFECGIADILTLYKKYDYINEDTYIYIDFDYDNAKSISEKRYFLHDNGNNKFNYKIKVLPQILTSDSKKNSEVSASMIDDANNIIDISSVDGYELLYSIDGAKYEKYNSAINGSLIYNNIIFKLKYKNNVIAEEVVEVIGNNYITSVEYINSNDKHEYTIDPSIDDNNNVIEWTCTNENIDISDGSVTFNDGLTGTFILDGSVGGNKKYEKILILVKNGERGEDGSNGKDGSPGEKGARGPIIYPAGVWDASKYYKADTDSFGNLIRVPYVEYLNDVGEDSSYYICISETSTNLSPEIDNTNTIWQPMSQFESIFTKLLVAKNGTIGKTVYSGDYMFSQIGTYRYKDDNNIIIIENSSNYKDFGYNVNDYEQSNLTIDDILCDDEMNGNIPSKFTPRMLFDFNTGTGYLNNGDIIFDGSGAIKAKNLILSTDEIGEQLITQDSNVDPGHYNHYNIYEITDFDVIIDDVSLTTSSEDKNRYMFLFVGDELINKIPRSANIYNIKIINDTSYGKFIYFDPSIYKNTLNNYKTIFDDNNYVISNNINGEELDCFSLTNNYSNVYINFNNYKYDCIYIQPAKSINVKFIPNKSKNTVKDAAGKATNMYGGEFVINSDDVFSSSILYIHLANKTYNKQSIVRQQYNNNVYTIVDINSSEGVITNTITISEDGKYIFRYDSSDGYIYDNVELLYKITNNVEEVEMFVINETDGHTLSVNYDVDGNTGTKRSMLYNSDISNNTCDSSTKLQIKINSITHNRYNNTTINTVTNMMDYYICDIKKYKPNINNI